MTENNIGEKAVNDLQKKFIVVGNHHVRGWYVWALIGVLAGVAMGFVYVSNQKGKVNESYAAFCPKFPPNTETYQSEKHGTTISLGGHVRVNPDSNELEFAYADIDAAIITAIESAHQECGDATQVVVNRLYQVQEDEKVVCESVLYCDHHPHVNKPTCEHVIVSTQVSTPDSESEENPGSGWRAVLAAMDAKPKDADRTSITVISYGLATGNALSVCRDTSILLDVPNEEEEDRILSNPNQPSVGGSAPAPTPLRPQEPEMHPSEPGIPVPPHNEPPVEGRR